MPEGSLERQKVFTVGDDDLRSQNEVQHSPQLPEALTEVQPGAAGEQASVFIALLKWQGGMLYPYITF